MTVVVESVDSAKVLEADARNRAVRTFVQGLVVAVVVAVAQVVNQGMAGRDPFDSATWYTVGAASVTAALTAATSYVMRRWLDASFVPTPLPPAPAAEPAAPVESSHVAAFAAPVAAPEAPASDGRCAY